MNMDNRINASYRNAATSHENGWCNGAMEIDDNLSCKFELKSSHSGEMTDCTNSPRISYFSSPEPEQAECPGAPHNTNQYLCQNFSAQVYDNNYCYTAETEHRTEENFYFDNSTESHFDTEDCSFDNLCMTGGTMKGMLSLNSSDFDDNLEEMKNQLLKSYFPENLQM